MLPCPSRSWSAVHLTLTHGGHIAREEIQIERVGYPSLVGRAFTDGRDDWVEKDNYSLSTRVVRGTLIIQRVYRPHLRFILMFDRHVEL